MDRARRARGSFALVFVACAVLLLQVAGAAYLGVRWRSRPRSLWPNDEITVYEHRFDGLRGDLFHRRAVGYVEDACSPGENPNQPYLLTQYSLAPCIVRRDTGPDLVVANLHASAAATDTILPTGFRVLRAYPSGVKLLGRQGPMVEGGGRSAESLPPSGGP